MKKEEVYEELIKLGRASSPKMCSYNNAQKLPGGGYGYCIVSMTDDTFYITDLEGMAMKLGGLLYKIPIAEMSEIRHSPRITLSPYLKFKWKGKQFVLGAIPAEMKAALGL